MFFYIKKESRRTIAKILNLNYEETITRVLEEKKNIRDSTKLTYFLNLMKNIHFLINLNVKIQ